MKNYLPDVCLVSPLHDPDGRLETYIRKNGKKLKNLYFGYIELKVTRKTHEKTLRALENVKISYSFQTGATGYFSIGKTYREAIKKGINLNTRYIHVCDFDRILHWADKFPNELKDVIGLIPSDYGLTFFCRTKRAFDTHPETQTKTESIVNDLASSKLGRPVDIMSGSFSMDINSAKIILKHSKRNDYSFYAEPLIIALNRKIPINTMIVDGLEWETPDQYVDKIRKEGYQDWLDEFMSVPEWKRRIELMEKNTEILTK